MVVKLVKWGAILACVLLVGYAILAYRTSWVSKLLKVQAEVTTLELEREGLKAALVVKPREVIREVPVTKVVERLVREGKVVPIASATVDTPTTEVAIPCSPLEKDTVVERTSDDIVHVVLVDANLTGWATILIPTHGDTPMWQGELTIHLKDRKGWARDIVTTHESDAVKVLFNKEVIAAVKAYKRPWLKKHLRPVCPAVGVSYDPFGGRVAASVFCGYGLTW